MNQQRITLVCRVVAACIIGGAGALKFASNPTDMFVFSELGMEPFGRFLIGTLELLSAMLLLSPFAAFGALLAVGTMLGAAIAHVSVLGFNVRGDEGMHVAMLLTVLATAGPVFVLRRRELPLVGSTL
jgi:putative oxidoreductase